MREPEIAATLAAEAKTVIDGDRFVDDIWSLVARLSQGMRERGGKWRAVVGIVRGGVFPARRVAEALGLDYREIHISHYRGTVRGSAPEVLQALPDAGGGEGLLVVDDVADSGGTALCVRAMLPGCDLAVVYAKPAGLRAIAADGGTAPFIGRRMDDKWIVFPWDQPGWDELSPKLVAAFRQRFGRVDPDQGVAPPVL